MGKDELSNPAEATSVPQKRTGGRPVGSKNKPFFTPEQCLHGADLLAADATRKAVATQMGISVQTSYAYISADDVEQAKLRRTDNIAKGIDVLPLQPRNVLAPGKRKGAAPQIDDKRNAEIMRTLLACNDYNEAARREGVNPRVIYRAIPAKTLQAVQDKLKAAKGQPITYLGEVIEPPKVKAPERKSGVAPKIDKSERVALRKLIRDGQSAEELAVQHGVSTSTLYRNLNLRKPDREQAKAARLVVAAPNFKMNAENSKIAALLIASGERSGDVRRHFSVSKTTLNRTVTQKIIAAAKAELDALETGDLPRPILPEIIRTKPNHVLPPKPEFKLKPDMIIEATRRLMQNDLRIHVAADMGVSLATLSRAISQKRIGFLRKQKDATAHFMNGKTRPEVQKLMGISRNELGMVAPPEVIQQLLAQKAAEERQQAREARLAEQERAKAHQALIKDIENNGVIAVPLMAAAENAFMRKGMNLPYGWQPHELWQSFIAHNEAVHTAYKQAPAGDALLDHMMIRYNFQRLTPSAIAASERDDFIRRKNAEPINGYVRETFLLLSKPAHGIVIGELWIDTHKRTTDGTRHTYVMNPQVNAPAPTTDNVSVMAAGTGRYMPLRPVVMPTLED